MKAKGWCGVLFFLFMANVACVTAGFAAQPESPQEKAMSDTLDTWREGRFEQLFEQLAHRGKTSREVFVRKMQEAGVRPACCWQKMENFRILNEKRTEATVYAKIGLEGTANPSASATREFKMTHQEGEWRMQLPDIMSLAGVTGAKKGARHHGRKNASPYRSVP